jgi:hypothetical protein
MDKFTAGITHKAYGALVTQSLPTKAKAPAFLPGLDKLL